MVEVLVVLLLVDPRAIFRYLLVFGDSEFALRQLNFGEVLTRDGLGEQLVLENYLIFQFLQRYPGPPLCFPLFSFLGLQLNFLL